jgi:hypothetical protein
MFVATVMVECAESTPVTLKVYVPAVVAGVLMPPDPEFDPPPHPMAPAATTIHTRAIIANQRRREAEMPIMSIPANKVPPLARPMSFIGFGASVATFEAAVVETVSAVTPLPLLATVTLVGLRLQVGKLCAPEGEPTSAQLTFNVPE